MHATFACSDFCRQDPVTRFCNVGARTRFLATDDLWGSFCTNEKPLVALTRCTGPCSNLAWLRALPYRAFGLFGGTTILGLTCAIPAYLEILGFGALGPIAGSISTGWESSLGLVAAENPFTFLQSAVMSKVATRVMTGIGVLSSAVTIATVIIKRTLSGQVSNCKVTVDEAVKMLKSFFEKWKTRWWTHEKPERCFQQ